jgi:hypothetical protein
MKTLILPLVFLLVFSFTSIAQRNPTKDRDKTGDRIDRINDGNPVRNPDHQREPIQPPYREKINPPKLPVPPEPVVIEIVEVWRPRPIVDYPPPERPIYDPPLPPFVDNPPALDELPLSEVYDLGIKNLDYELYNEAIKCFNILLKDDPLNYEFYTLRGRAYHGLELFDRAKKDFQKAVKINKSYADGYYYLGLTEISLGNIDEAIVDFGLAADFGNEKAKGLLKKYFKQ